MKKPEIKDKGGLLTGTSWLKKQKFQQKSKVVKFALKRKKSELFGTKVDRNLVKTATFGTKLGQ